MQSKLRDVYFAVMTQSNGKTVSKLNNVVMTITGEESCVSRDFEAGSSL